MDKIVRKRIVFYGDVQGVGFRYRAYHAANHVGATGWVRNCFDGSVEMEIQGNESQINKVLVMINDGKYIDIRDMKVKNIDVMDDRGFGIR